MSAPEAAGGRLVRAALRCYPARWRRRHEEEAAELAALLIRDGVPAASIAWSYLAGAAREWLAPRPGRPLSAAAAALVAAACLIGFSAALVAGTVPAKAAPPAQSPSSQLHPKVQPAHPGPAASSLPQVIPCPVLPRQVAGAAPAASHPQPSIEGHAHARSC
jgi:hypothetical protein